MLNPRLFWLSAVLLLAGCSIQQEGVHQSGVPVEGAALEGVVRGGQQPIVGSTVQMYAVSAADGAAASALLTSAATTDASGSFTLPHTYTCPSSAALVYVVATGGNPGLAAGTNNASIAMAAALGACGTLSATPTINIDEVTTVAAAYALAPFATSASAIGASAADASALGASFSLAAAYANPVSGTAPGMAVPVGTAVPATRLNALAGLLSTCVNSAGGVAGDKSRCGSLFSLATPNGGSPPTNTFAAILTLAANPTLNTGNLFNLIPASGPFQPTLSVAPSDFSLGLGVTQGLLPSASTLSFGSTSIATPASVQTLTLTNNGSSAIALTSLAIHGVNAGDFTDTTACPASLNGGSTCTVQVTFAPSATGSRIAVLAFANSSSNATLLVTLGGTGTSGNSAPQLLSAAPASVPVGTSGATITLTGTGFTPATIVYLQGAAQATTFLSSQAVSFPLSFYNAAYPGTLSMFVRANGGLTSNVLNLTIVNPAPTLTAISPATVLAGSPSITLSLTGSNILTGTTALVNGTSYTISSYASTTGTIQIPATVLANPGTLAVTLVTPAPGGGTSSPQQLQLIGGPDRLRTLSYPNIDIAADNVNHLLYASVSSLSTISPNSIISINPLLGTVVATQTLSTQPGQLAVTSDGSYLYVSLPATGQIERLLLPSLTPDITFALGNGRSARDLETAPGAPHTLAVTMPNPTTVLYSPADCLTIFDDGVPRPQVVTGGYTFASYDTVAWGADATTLYGAMAQYSGGPEYIFTVGPSGPTLKQSISTAFQGFDSRLTFNTTNGLLYDGYGDAVTAANGTTAGKFNVENTLSYEQNPFAIDSVNGRAFFLNENSTIPGALGFTVDIQAFDLNRYTYLNALEVPNLTGSRIVEIGTSTLAVGGGSQIFLIDGPFVSPGGVSSPVGGYAAPSPTLTTVAPQTATVDSSDVTLTLTGANFTQAAVVTWNGKTLPSTWQSATQVTATIPAALLTQALSAAVYVSNGAGTESSVGQPFTVLPDLGPNTQIEAVDLAGQDMAWDALRGLLYVAVTDPQGLYGNSLAVVSPASATIQSTMFLGNQPSSLGISDDDVYLYTGFQTASVIKRIALSDLSLNLTIPLTLGGISESFAGDVKVAPGQNQTIAVSMGNIDIEPRNGGGLAIFDNAVQRPGAIPQDIPAYKFTWGKDATSLIGHSDPEFTPQSLAIYPISGTGLSSSSAYGTAYNLGLRPHYDAGTNLVYSDFGAITNPVTGASAGTLPTSNGVMVPDSSLNRAYVLHSSSSQSGAYSLDIYSLQPQTLLRTITLPGFSGYPTQMLRWGTEGLAILTDNQTTPGTGLLYLLQGSDISGLSTPPPGAISLSPATVQVGSVLATVIVTGAGFAAGSTATVGGSPRATTVVSPTQLTFQLTAADVSFASYLDIVVLNPGGSATPATSLTVSNPIPSVASLGSPKLLLNASAITVTIIGTGFAQTSVASLNGTARTTTYISSTQLSFPLNYSDLTTAGTYPVTVYTPGPGGGTSNTTTLEVDNPAPTLNSLNYATIAAGSAAGGIYLTGSGMIPATVVQVNGSARATSHYGSTEVGVLLTAADLASAGTLSFIAVNPAPGGGNSAPVTLTVTAQ